MLCDLYLDLCKYSYEQHSLQNRICTNGTINVNAACHAFDTGASFYECRSEVDPRVGTDLMAV